MGLYIKTTWNGKECKELNTKSLDQIISGCKQNRLKDQELLYKHFYSYAMSVCLIYSDSQEDAVEIMNDGFMKVFKHIRKQQEPKAIKGWLRRIMINTAIDHYRKNHKHRNHYELDYTQQGTSEKEIYGSLAASEILGLLQYLPGAYRTVFNLYVLEGYPHKEIAQMLDISEGTSRANLSYANKELRKMLAGWLNVEHLKWTI